MATSQRKKLVYSIDTPFSTIQWPEISLEDQDAILELLCSLLTPIGQHRQRHVKPSEGKRAAKRKRKEEGGESKASAKTERPPAPEIASFVDVGLTSITRNLEKLASGPELATENDAIPSSASPYALIFVARSGQSSAFNSQLPQMVAVASKHSHSTPATRLVGYSKPCGDKLSTCLGIPRVSSVGIRVGAPMSKALIEFVNKHVSPVRIAWLEEAQDAKYRQMQLKTEEKIILKKAGKA
ncbi:RNase p and RNase mrp subunit [Colletotrichum asianum]|uniref:RNase p and RNase mrp subunit n=1 Tax=Colletotrichum asianum TaxID=702518 RepID=A0A8H3WIK7_9PEZI|nr:RNase p and RNase mrp subunit [Colletotrichum asianum]